ncbi:MAG TPA: hypothetical protein PK251_15825 [Candidatus Latescibacteria bacterium]|jgi:hypothetical protein|nr:hypothetical protein [Candidatus Latescibacterota bacterium]
MIGEQRGLCEEQKKPLNNLFCKTNEETYSREEEQHHSQDGKGQCQKEKRARVFSR